MVEQAVILPDPFTPGAGGRPGNSQKVLLGLTLLQRLILTLAYGGIRRIVLLGREADPSRPAFMKDDAALKKSGAVLQRTAFGQRSVELPLPDAPFLLLDGSAVFTMAFVQWIHGLHSEKNWLLFPAGMDAPLAGLGRDLCFSGLAVCQADQFPRLLALPADGYRAEDMNALFPPSTSEARLVRDRSWVLVNSSSSKKQVRHLLRRSMGKPSDGFFSRHLNRHVSWPISRLLVRLRVRPTQVTVVNLALGLFSGWLIGRGGYGPTLAAGLLFQFVSIFDGCDGEIARLTFRFSTLGTKLDNLCDLVVLVVFFVNLPIGLYAATADVLYPVLGMLMALFVAVFYLMLLVRIRLSGHQGNIAEIARQVQDKGKSHEPLHWLERLGVHLGFIYRKEFISLYAMVCCLVNKAGALLWTIDILTPVGLVYQVYSIWKLRKKSAGVA
jgi:phosphatidylglycerophosphate synthase